MKGVARDVGGHGHSLQPCRGGHGASREVMAVWVILGIKDHGGEWDLTFGSLVPCVIRDNYYSLKGGYIFAVLKENQIFRFDK